MADRYNPEGLSGALRAPASIVADVQINGPLPPVTAQVALVASRSSLQRQPSDAARTALLEAMIENLAENFAAAIMRNGIDAPQRIELVYFVGA